MMALQSGILVAASMPLMAIIFVMPQPRQVWRKPPSLTVVP
jgi:hypothetical protein